MSTKTFLRIFRVTRYGSPRRISDGKSLPSRVVGLYTSWLYIEMVQGVDLTIPAFRRWLRVGIPNRGVWSVCIRYIDLNKSTVA
jgi:hypothetical protein